MISRQASPVSLPPATCGVAPSREWRLPWERGQAPFRPFTNILQAAGDVCRALPDSSAMERVECLLWIYRHLHFSVAAIRGDLGDSSVNDRICTDFQTFADLGRGAELGRHGTDEVTHCRGI